LFARQGQWCERDPRGHELPHSRALVAMCRHARGAAAGGQSMQRRRGPGALPPSPHPPPALLQQLVLGGICWVGLGCGLGAADVVQGAPPGDGRHQVGQALGLPHVGPAGGSSSGWVPAAAGACLYWQRTLGPRTRGCHARLHARAAGGCSPGLRRQARRRPSVGLLTCAWRRIRRSMQPLNAKRSPRGPITWISSCSSRFAGHAASAGTAVAWDQTAVRRAAAERAVSGAVYSAQRCVLLCSRSCGQASPTLRGNY